jgi:hypothetical protein
VTIRIFLYLEFVGPATQYFTHTGVRVCFVCDADIVCNLCGGMVGGNDPSAVLPSSFAT